MKKDQTNHLSLLNRKRGGYLKFSLTLFFSFAFLIVFSSLFAKPAQAAFARGLHVDSQVCVAGSFPWGSQGVRTTFHWTRGDEDATWIILQQALDITLDSGWGSYLGTSNPPSTSDTSYTTGAGSIGPLEPNKPHYWRINTRYQLFGWQLDAGSYSSFNTINCAVPTPTPTLNPATNLQINNQVCVAGGVETTFSWTRGTGGTIGTQYLDVSTDGGATYIGATNPPSSADTTYLSRAPNMIGPLTPNTPHWWRINTDFGTPGSPNWRPSPWASFNTINCGGPTPTPTVGPTPTPTGGPTPTPTGPPLPTLTFEPFDCVANFKFSDTAPPGTLLLVGTPTINDYLFFSLDVSGQKEQLVYFHLIGTSPVPFTAVLANKNTQPIFQATAGEITCEIGSTTGGFFSFGSLFDPLKNNPFGNSQTLTLGSFISSILPVIFAFAGFIFLIFIFVSGFQMIVSRGEPEDLAHARGRMFTAIIGFVVIFLAFVITRVIQIAFGFNIL